MAKKSEFFGVISTDEKNSTVEFWMGMSRGKKTHIGTLEKNVDDSGRAEYIHLSGTVDGVLFRVTEPDPVVLGVRGSVYLEDGDQIGYVHTRSNGIFYIHSH